MPTPTLHFTLAEFHRRIARTRAAMQDRGIDTLIVSDPSNMNWLTGYDGWSFYFHQCVVLGLDDAPIWRDQRQEDTGYGDIE